MIYNFTITILLGPNESKKHGYFLLYLNTKIIYTLNLSYEVWSIKVLTDPLFL